MNAFDPVRLRIADRVQRRRLAVDDKLAGIEPVEALEAAQQSRFPRAIVAEQRDDFSTPNRDIGVDQRLHVTKALGDVLAGKGDTTLRQIGPPTRLPWPLGAGLSHRRHRPVTSGSYGDVIMMTPPYRIW
jgi:hypothetical protein